MMEKIERVAESEGMNMSTQNESVLEKAVVSTTTTTTTTATETTQKMPLVDIEDENEEEIDDEEALFVEIEKEKEKEEAEEAAHPHPHHYDIQSAPKLLQDALKTGAIKADLDSKDSKVHSTPKKEVKKEPVEGAITAEIDDEKKNEFGDVDAAVDANQEHSPTVAEKVNQLDFLLDKASQYSSFIARDLQELQDSLTDSARNKLEKAAKKEKKRKSKAGTKPIFIQPPNLADGCILKDYQLEGVRWLVSLFENGVSGILADEMGLGKTIQVIAMIAHLLTQKVTGPFLVVAPLATLPNWIREIEKWLPDQPVVRFHGTGPWRESLLKGPLNPKQKKDPKFPIVVTSYEVAMKDQVKLAKLCEFTYLIVDEGQRLKNHRCTLLSALKRLKAQNRLLLSGTPIQNNLDELWSLLNFVNPTIFDDLSIFQSWFGFKDIGQNTRGATNEEEILLEQRKNQTVSKLHEILRPFLLRRIKKDVLLDMPPKKEVVVYSGLSALQRGYAEMIDKGLLRDQLIAQGIEMGRTLSQTNNQMNHRKNVNHPFLFGEPIDAATGSPIGTAHPHLLIKASGKFSLLDRMLERLFKDKHQVLIFSQMTALLNVIEDYLIYRNWKYCRIDGSTNIDERQRQMDVFNLEKTSGKDGGRNEGDDRHFVFLLSTRAGGLGINLTCADTCIIFDSDWNPHQDSQAMDRCHRIGQTRPVAVYRLLTFGSVDIDMMEKALSKKKLERMAIAGGGFKTGHKASAAMSFKTLADLLMDDIKDLQSKGQDEASVMISDEEFNLIMDRGKLFAEGENAVPTEGRMYDIIEAAGGDLLGAMET
ncbi:Class II histone deacetylase complex subunits 2 and 3 [Fragilaria crotonensis]|nr:Class II histone deacetylase complex subunits 2 and 3 [Fragilaria crotonensis]